jgi:aminoglycoside phosphotransferase (APT) family kinase protein
VPRVLLANEGESTEESPRWILLSHLPGQPLAQVRDTLESWDLGSVSYEAGRYLAHIHQITVDAFGTLFSDGPDSQVREKVYILAEADRCLAECSEHGLLDSATGEELHSHLVDTELLTRRQPCLLHGEFQSANLIVEQGMTGHHITGIRDFAHAQGGSPEQDIATFFAHDLAGESTAQKEFLDGYAESGELLASFWDRLALYQAFISLRILARAGPYCAPKKQRLYVDSIVAYLNSR